MTRNRTAKMHATQPNISIIIAAHREGLIAHKTLLSIDRAVQALKQAGISYEILATIDNGDEATTRYFDAHAKTFNITVHKIDVRDLGAARNYGVGQAKGDYIATVDADDLVSENWFVEALSFLQTHQEEMVVHTQYSVNFGTQNIVWEKFDSRSKEEDAIIMTWANRWDSAVVAARAVFERFPYQSNQAGFGSEDWHFNSQTLAHDIPHRVVPETVLFVRRKDVSEMTLQAADRRTVHYTDLLDFDFVKHISPTDFPDGSHAPTSSLLADVQSLAVKGSKKAYKALHRVPALEQRIRPLASKLQPYLRPASVNRFPEWLLAEWRAIHVLEKDIFPASELVASIPLYHSEMYELGDLYRAAVSHFTNLPDFIIFVPYLVPGGADLVAINYAKALQAVHPDWHIAVIATENTVSPWATKLPAGVDFIPFGELAGGLDTNLRLQVLARLIVQSKCKRLYINQSGLGFDFVKTYAKLLQENDYTIYAAAFCEDEDQEGHISGHIHSSLPAAYPFIDKIFTDNRSIVSQLEKEYAFSADKFSVHYQPVESTDSVTLSSSHDGPYRILWAGRIAKQKRPDILRQIAEQIDPTQYHIDVYGTLQEGYVADYFENLESLTYKGAYSGTNQLPTSDYDAFLYTSENDGLPNILLEIGARSLPIIAPAVGGIPELVKDQKTGLLVDSCDNVKAYVAALSQLRGNPELAGTLRDNMIDQISRNHTVRVFEKAIKKDIQ